MYMMVSLAGEAVVTGSEVVGASGRRTSIGLVLSGGGAKGVAHIGLIAALEENAIPIDYVTGTSIGAVVGSLYAIGLSPREMMDIICGRDFEMWQTGVVDNRWIAAPAPDGPQVKAFTLRVAVGDTTRRVGQLFARPSLVNPAPMKFGMMELYALPALRCRSSFDSLFVPFRAVASDVCAKRPVILGQGDLGEAVRASMSFPFVFEPTTLDGAQLYDGGIYDNFPIDVMNAEFHPDFIIGSVVADNPACPKAHDLIGQLESMVMQYTDYAVADSAGVRIRMRLPDVGLLDFRKAEAIFAVGYEAGLAMSDSIRRRLAVRRPLADVQAARRRYRAGVDTLDVRRIEICGLTEGQRRYVGRYFRGLDREALRRGFYALAADDRMTNLSLRLVDAACPPDGMADTAGQVLQLTMMPRRDVAFRLGGLLTTLDGSRFYTGVGYRGIGRVAFSLQADALVGPACYSSAVTVGTEIPAVCAVTARLRLCWHRRTFGHDEMVLPPRAATSRIKVAEAYAVAETGVALGRRSLMTADVGLCRPQYQVTDSVRVATTYRALRIGASFSYRKMKEISYPDRGTYARVDGHFYHSDDEQRWWTFRSRGERYWPVGRHYSLGGSVEAVWSDIPNLVQPQLSPLRLPSFEPYGYAMQSYNAYLRARRYVTLGLSSVAKPVKNLQLRLDAYWFRPWQVSASRRRGRSHIVAEATCVLKTPVADFAGFIHEAWTGGPHFHIGLRAGFLWNEARF